MDTSHIFGFMIAIFWFHCYCYWMLKLFPALLFKKIVQWIYNYGYTSDYLLFFSKWNYWVRGHKYSQALMYLTKLFLRKWVCFIPSSLKLSNSLVLKMVDTLKSLSCPNCSIFDIVDCSKHSFPLILMTTGPSWLSFTSLVLFGSSLIIILTLIYLKFIEHLLLSMYCPTCVTH